MSSTSPNPQPFQMKVGYDQAELLGARWWHEGLQAAYVGSRRTTKPPSVDESRRTALKVLVGLGGGVLLVGVVIGMLDHDDPPTDPVLVDSASLDLQRTHGLDYQAKGTSFVWQDTTPASHAGTALDSNQLERLATDLRPSDPVWLPAYVPTLFQAFAAPGRDELLRSLQLVHSPKMATAYRRGEAVRELLEHAIDPTKWALVVDLPGPESVAFAAALTPTVSAVFTFDNWPHPRGVVPSHLTLGAVLYYRERFVANEQAAAGSPTTRRPAAFVLDRARLSPYANESGRFDNRYATKLPNAAFLKQLGVERLLYVVPEGGPAIELEDLNARFVEYRTAGIEVRMLGLGDLTLATPPATASTTTNNNTPRYYWGGSYGSHWWFWNHYGWPSRPGPVPAERPPTNAFGAGYRPAPRDTAPPTVARLGRTIETRPGSSSGSRSSSGSSGGSWGRSSGGFGG